MKRQYKWLSYVLSLVMIITYMLPINIFADEINAAIEIVDVSQSQSNLQPGDTFSLKVKTKMSRTISEDGQEVYVIKPIVSGEGVDTSNLGFSVTCNIPNQNAERITQDTQERIVTITGLKYIGDSKDINIVIRAGSSLSANETYGLEVYGTETIDYTLSAKTSSDFTDTLTVDKKENIIVKTGETQSVKVNITNKADFTINAAEATLKLSSSVEGLKIKTDKTTVKNIKTKETKAATFSVSVDEDVKAGVYPATLSVLGNSYPINLQVDSNVVPSTLEVSAVEDKVFTPGVAQKINFSIKNVGDRAAKNVRLEVVNSENVSIVGGSNVKNIGVIASKASEKADFTLKVPASVKTPTVPIALKLTYLSSTAEKAEDTQYIYLNTTASAASSEVVISNVTAPTTTFGVDQNFNIKFNVSSKGVAENLKISVTGDEGIVPKSQNLFFIDKLNKGETKQFNVTMAATAAAVSSAHAIEIKVEYGEGPITVTQYGSVNITNPKKDKEQEGDDKNLKNKPIVIVGQYAVNPVVVKAGENFNLAIGFMNTHKTKAVHNLKANLKIVAQGEKDTGTVFAPVKASNTFYIADLQPGEMLMKEITMYTIPSASPRTYEISVEMTYEDEEGNEIPMTENIGIPVEQPTKIDIGDISVDIGQVGMPTSLSALLYNTGKTNVTNVVVHIEGEGFSVQDNKVFIGELQSQQQETYEPSLIPEKEGILTGQLIIDYEDTTGEAKQIVHEFSFEVEPAMEMPEEVFDEEMLEEEAPKSNLKLKIGIAVGIVVIIGVIVVVILKKRKKKKEEMMLDEDD